MAQTGKPRVLVIAPMPAAPASAGNRRRLVVTCEALRRGGFAIDLAYLQHEDQVYRRFGQHPPTDSAAMAAAFDRFFTIPVATPVPLKTWTDGFGLDAWCPVEASDFVRWYFDRHPETGAVVVNYVFLSRCLNAVPDGVARIIDTHDRFADRHLQYRPFRTPPNFFYTDRASEAVGLSRADTILAIQPTEAAHFRTLTDRRVQLLPPCFREQARFRTPERLRAIGFIGHGNDPNLFSISKFAHAWAASWTPDHPVLVIAGEICGSLDGLQLPGVRLAGYVDAVETFYAGIDAVVAPMLMGSGLKMKVGEALAHGRPVIGTRIAFEGFETDHPDHGLDGIAETVAAVLRHHADPAGLAALTAACADLLSRYNATAAACEAAWLATIPRRPAPAASPPAGAIPGPRRSALGGTILWEERSLRSLPSADDQAGILVATEDPPPTVACTADYAPERRRWFARPASDGEATAPDRLQPPPDLHGVSVRLAPEWIHRRALPQHAREALAGIFGGARSDWVADGRLIGHGPGGLTVVTSIPSFLVARHRATAAFALAGSDPARELSLSEIAPLARAPGLTVTTRRDDLTPVPVILTFAPSRPAGPRTGAADAEGGHPETSPAAAVWPDPPEAVLLLSDDLIGRLRVGPPTHSRCDARS